MVEEGIEKFIEEMEKEKAKEEEAKEEEKEEAKEEIVEKKIKKREEKEGEIPSGWSEDYYGVKREGDKYISRRNIIVSEDENGVIREMVT